KKDILLYLGTIVALYLIKVISNNFILYYLILYAVQSGCIFVWAKGGKHMAAIQTINEKRLLETFEVSSSIGQTENGGLNRLALSEEDKQIRDIFVKWLKDENLEVRIDDFGNIYGRREGKI